MDKSDQDSFASPKEPRRPPLAGYANYFEVGHNAFEFLLDAGQIEPQSGTIRFTDRIAITPVNAKLLSELLARSITQLESAHGPSPERRSDWVSIQGTVAGILGRDWESRSGRQHPHYHADDDLTLIGEEHLIVKHRLILQMCETAEAIAADGLPLAGWVANLVDAQTSCIAEVLITLEQRLAAPCLGCVPRLDAASPAAVAEHLDPGRLLPRH